MAHGPLESARLLLDSRREVPDSLDLVLGQQYRAHRFKVQPLVRLPLESAVVEVEPVHVDIRDHATRVAATQSRSDFVRRRGVADVDREGPRLS